MTTLSISKTTFSLGDRAASLFRTKCPDCGKRGLVCQNTEASMAGEVAPRYYSCSCCEARFVHATFGSWTPANTPEFALAFDN